MTDLVFRLTMTATAEVRDKDGNLKGTEPIEIVTTVTEAEAKAIQADADSRADQ